jgi:Secretion system C-terminal sorting domain/Pregnancy-associated plasma protein-A
MKTLFPNVFTKHLYAFVCTLFFFLSVSFNTNAQAQSCRVQHSDYTDFPIATVKVNFHFLPVRPSRGANYTQAEADNVASQIVGFANENMADLASSNIPPFVGGVQDSKIRFELFDGGQGSVFVYSGTFDPNGSGSTNAFVPRYGTQVLNVVVGYYDFCDNTGDPGFNVITMCDFDRDIVTNMTKQQNRALVLCHEIGHTLNLLHTFQCTTQCSSDIDHNVECGGTCGCSTPSNPSNNMMSYNGGNKSLTPCQWEIMFNYILDNNPPFINWDYDNCSTTNNNLVISSSSVTWITPKFFKKNIVIEPGASLIIRCKVRMGVNNTITVKRGARLIVDGGIISNLCSYNTWGGISVWGNSNLTQPDPTSIPSSNEAGILFLKNNAIIEGTRTAISASRRDDGTVSWYDLIQYYGGVVYANNATFRNMTRAVEFLSYHCIGGNCIDDDKSAFIDCTFKNEPNVSGAQGVTIWDTNGITFEGCSFEGFTDAILTYDAGIEVKRSTQFQINPSFTYNAYGLNMIATYPNSFGTTVRNTTFSNNSYGIYSTASNSVRRHNFTSNIFSSSNGIYLEGTSWFSIEKNIVGSGIQGISLYNTGNPNNFVKCNTISGMYQGISVYRDNVGLKLLGNTFMSNYGSDIYLLPSIFGSRIAPSQGSEAVAAGNLFSSNNNSIPAIDHKNRQNRPGTYSVEFRYYLPNTVTPVTNSNLVPRCNLTDINLSPAPQNCTNTNPNKFTVIVNQSNSVTNCTESEGFDDENGDEYVFYSLRTDVQNLTESTKNGRNKHLYPELTEKSGKKNNMLNVLLKKAISTKDIQLAKRLLKDETEDNNKKKLIGVCFSLKEWQEAKSFLNGLPNQVEAWRDFKSVQLINLDRLKSSERFKLTPNQRRTLLEIVDKEDIDNASYAKALLQLIEGMRFEPRREGLSSTDIGNSALMMKPTPSKTITESIAITPNPAKDQVNFTIPASFKIQRLDIYGIDGHLYRSINVENEKITTDTNGMSGGLYIVKFMDEQGISQQITKLFINK